MAGRIERDLPTSADAVVVGAGICGVTAAEALARRGLRVVVVERGAGPGMEQSGRAQGAIRVQGREAAELPRAATQFFAGRAAAAGAQFHYGTLAERIVETDGTVRGLETSRGRIEASAVIVTGGIWTAHLAATAGVSVPVMPVALSQCETE